MRQNFFTITLTPLTSQNLRYLASLTYVNVSSHTSCSKNFSTNIKTTTFLMYFLMFFQQLSSLRSSRFFFPECLSCFCRSVNKVYVLQSTLLFNCLLRYIFPHISFTPRFSPAPRVQKKFLIKTFRNFASSSSLQALQIMRHV